MRMKTLIPLAVLCITLLTCASSPDQADTSISGKTYLLSMITVPAGSFQRDDNPDNISVITKAFLISQYEITREQFTIVMGVDPTQDQYSSGIMDPVGAVCWYHAIAFCNKLSLMEGLTPVYSIPGVDFSAITFEQAPKWNISETWNLAAADFTANGYRLPTEMEWMWAAMGAPEDGQNGGVNTTGYKKAFAGSTGSNEIGDYALFGYHDFEKNKGEIGTVTIAKSNPVGSKFPNELDLFDMSGNASELCWDWFEYGNEWPYYKMKGTIIDYTGSETGTQRVIRGGNWYTNTASCSVAYRIGISPNSEGYQFGIRVVRPVSD